MTAELDLADIQGHALKAYGRFGYPLARYVFLNIKNSKRAREFIAAVTSRVTTAVEWGTSKNQVPAPALAVNIAFTYQGLKELELPRASLVGFSPEFVEGMQARKDILGDDGPSDPQYWDPIWRDNRSVREKDVHIGIFLNAKLPTPVSLDATGITQAMQQCKAELEGGYNWLLKLVSASQDGVSILGGNCGDDGAQLDYQDVSALIENGFPSAKEHFGYTDGIGDPVLAGVPYDKERVGGRGKQMEDGSWQPLAAGEFLLGNLDEALEYPPAPAPKLLARNGTYLVYRKLHENVASFDQFLHQEAAKAYPAENGYSAESGVELMAAKFVGRWRDNGAPLVSAPTPEKKREFDARFARATELERDRMLSNFTYDEDMSGARCPFSSHLRRINPRASLEMGSDPSDTPGSLKRRPGAFDTPGALSNRRRLMRRGLPYGSVKDRSRNDGNHGIVIMLLNADINRQFEFVQQQWINYGNDFRAANDKEIILGNHSQDPKFRSKAVIQVEPESQEVPYLLVNLPRFVETRGGEYFFMPGMTALRMIARGVIDPT